MSPILKSVRLPNQVELPYAEQGDPSGVPVLLLHAIADSWQTFEPLLAHLPDNIHAFALTQRGHGDASRPARGYRIGDFAADLNAFLNEIQLEASVIVGGSSGGFVARRFAIDHPERTLGLVLMGSPATLHDKPGIQGMWISTISKLNDPIDPGFVREFAASTLAQPIPHSFFETIVKENMKVPAFVWRATFEGLMEDRSFEDLHSIKAPTLIIWGEHDAILSKGDQEALAEEIPDSRLVVYADAGHAFYWEAPDRVASDLVAFISTLNI
jgi:pimeloyl-ACP methyl ester carboxylesterase